jgi:hypothetical protein
MGQQSSTSAELNEDPWYRPDLMTKDYDQYGDAYEDNTYEKLCEEWKVTTCVNPRERLCMGRDDILLIQLY